VSSQQCLKLTFDNVMALESAEVLKEDKDSGLDVLVFGADVNSDEACAQRSMSSCYLLHFLYLLCHVPAVTVICCIFICCV